MVQRRVRAGAVAAAVVGALVAALAVPAAVTSAAPDRPAAVRGVDDEVRINQIQVVGSHNSYKRMVSPAEEALRREAWLDEPPRGVTALFGDMTSALLAAGLRGIWNSWRDEETAQALSVSEPTVKRDWSAARAWLAREMAHG